MKEFPSCLVSIEKLSAKGFGVGFIQKKPTSLKAKVVVPLSIPEEEVMVEVGPKKQGAYVGKLIQVTKSSPKRAPLRCRHAPVCGGCTLQHIEYLEQTKFKEQEIKGLFSFIPKEVFSPIIIASTPWYYRNKMEFTFSQDKEGNRFLGLMKVQSKGRVETIVECHLCPSWFNNVLGNVRLWWEESKALAYHPFSDRGSLRTLTVREGKNTQDKMILLTVSGNPEFALSKEQLASFVKSIEPVLQGTGKYSIFLRVQQAIAGQPTQFYEMKLAGEDHIQEELEISVGGYRKRYRFLISPTAFFQPNTSQAEKIYAKALELAGLRKRKWVLDLYAGTATLGMIFAPFAEQVLSIELNPYAVFDAQSNQEINEITNLQVVQGDVAQVLKQMQAKDSSLQNPDLIVVDPPRTGLGKDALDVILKLNSKEIIYISCSPATQAQDCLELIEKGYEIVFLQPIDQFPHTMHVENIVLLQKRGV